VYIVNNRTRHIFLIALILAGTFLFSSCNRAKTPAPKRYPFTGRVVSIDSQAQSALIDGDAVPGFMDGMAMTYKVKPAATLSHLNPGDSISAEVVSEPEDENGRSDYWLENVRVTARSSSSAAGTSSLHMPVPREQVPDFSFVNQDGKSISVGQYRGKVLLVTFIYTRCPFPDFCPRMSANFAKIYEQFAIDRALANVQLLSISFDPDHDGPKVLRDYGFSVAHTHDAALFRRWNFAVPRQADLPKIADFFALTVKPEGGLITHNLSTAMIGPDGKIVEWYHGGDWQISDLMNYAINAASGFSPP
jgi:protein SCO1